MGSSPKKKKIKSALLWGLAMVLAGLGLVGSAFVGSFVGTARLVWITLTTITWVGSMGIAALGYELSLKGVEHDPS